MVIVTFRHAKGVPVNFIDWKWIGDEVFAKSWGRWIGLLHVLCRYGLGSIMMNFYMQCPGRGRRNVDWLPRL